MQSSLIGKIEKARRYAEEPDRVTFTTFSVRFRGENSEYETSYRDGAWHCTCSFFAASGQYCSHTMAVERPHQPVRCRQRLRREIAAAHH